MTDTGKKYVYTSEGLIERDRLERREDFGDNEKECWHAIEYYLDGRLVKRGVSLHIKKGIEVSAEVKQNG